MHIIKQVYILQLMNVSQIAEKLKLNSKKLPINKTELEYMLETLFHQILFPINSAECETESIIEEIKDIMYKNISNLLSKENASEITDKFICQLPIFQESLLVEAECFLENDPASKSIEEVILSYPGFFALVVHRIAHFLNNLDVPLIPRIFSEYAHAKVGVDIHPGAEIGNNFYIDHGTGIVIGETTVIGNNVKIYQGVTLGALYVAKDLQNKKRHPTIEDNVVIYAGATLLGGNTIVGHDSVIGGNVWLTKSVIPYSLVYHTSEVRIRTTNDFDDALNFNI